MSENSSFKGNGRLLTGIVLSVLTFWLFAQSLVNIAPTLHEEFSSNMGLINTTISITALFSGMLVVSAGDISDKVGHIKMAYIGLWLNILGSILIILTSSLTLLFLGRIIQGISAAIIMPSTLSIVKSYYIGKHRQAALSYWSIGSWGGGGIASFLGGIVSTFLGWRWIFVISILVSILALILIKGTPETVRKGMQFKKKFDYIGTILLVILILSINLIITQSLNFGILSTTILSLIFIFIISTILFILVEKNSKTPLINFSIFKDRGFTGSTSSNFLMNAVAGTLIVGNTFVQEYLHFNSFQSGLLTITYLITVLVTIKIGEKILQHFGAKKPMVIGTLLNTIGIIFIALTFLPSNLYIISCVIGYFIYGLGLGFYATPSMDTVVANSNQEHIGMASGVYKMSSSLGNAFGVALSSTLYLVAKSAFNVQFGAFLGFAFNIALAFIALIIVFIAIPNSNKNYN